ncbi:hypothetical protein [uncultured Paracoccus sp.]|uniref:hypothetical protein n=1 Tax=uncultured Paracoccus sp. TaxID=189685 RepID=UPI00263300F6|nr:hypothetical protein [uncultured Paracoccus sp.]
MVLRFKLRTEDRVSYDISKDQVEARIARNRPWFVAGTERRDDRHYAVCPWCDNPIQLKALYRRDTIKRPHGSHTGKPQAGVGRFDLSRQLNCPYRLTRQPGAKDDRRPRSEDDRALIAFVRDEFDRIVLTLRRDLGVSFSNDAARRMLQSWFENSGFLYRHINFRNLPWMIVYLAVPLNLYRQKGFAEEIKASIQQKVSSAEFDQAGRLQSTAPWLALTLQPLHHRIRRDPDDRIEESMKLWIKDYSRTNDPSRAPLIHQAVVTFDHDRFERLVATPPDRARRDDDLLEIARQILGEP